MSHGRFGQYRCPRCKMSRSLFKGWTCHDCRDEIQKAKDKAKGRTRKGKASAGFGMGHKFGRE